MKTLSTLACIVSLTLLVSCAQMESPEIRAARAEGSARAAAYEARTSTRTPSQGRLLIDEPIPQGRNYATNPITAPPLQGTQPNFGINPGEQYQTIMVNTPSGMVYKRCKVLNGQVVACF